MGDVRARSDVKKMRAKGVCTAQAMRMHCIHCTGNVEVTYQSFERVNIFSSR